MSTTWSALSLAVLVLVNMVIGQNDTTETPTTAAPSVFTTQFFNFTTTLATLRPSASPTTAPTLSPTIAIGSGQSALYKVITKFAGADCSFIETKKETFIIIFCSASDLPECGSNGEGARVDITDCTAGAIPSRRLLSDLSLSEVDVTFSVAIKDATNVNTFEQTLDTSFQDSFQAEMSVEYDFITLAEVTGEYEGTGDGDEFFGDSEPTFGERLEGPYVVVGIICIVIGTTWLLLMWREQPFVYPSYKDGLAGASGQSNAVELELVPASSAGDAQ